MTFDCRLARNTLARNTLTQCFLEIFDISHFDQKEINSVHEFLLSSYSANNEQLPVQQNSTFRRLEM